MSFTHSDTPQILVSFGFKTDDTLEGEPGVTQGYYQNVIRVCVCVCKS